MWKDYLSLSRREQLGFLVLAVLTLILFVVRMVAPVMHTHKDLGAIVKDSIPLLIVPIEDSKPSTFSHEPNHQGSSLNIPEPFDPNTVSYAQLIDFGISQRLARTWCRYIESGGGFARADDVKKIYGMDDELLASIQPFLRFDDKDDDSNHYELLNPSLNRQNLDLNRDSLPGFLSWTSDMLDTVIFWRNDYWFPVRYSVTRLKNWNMDTLEIIKHSLYPKIKEITNDQLIRIDINSADTLEWQLLHGIGPVLSRRILNYRNALGGFVSVNQLSEVYGVSPVLFTDIEPFLFLDTIQVRTINVNSASVRLLRAHPYLDFYKAKDLVDGRINNGSFKKVEEVRDYLAVSETEWKVIKKYFCVGD